MRVKFVLVFAAIIASQVCTRLFAQGGVNEANSTSLGGNAMAANKMINTDVNIYTGLPSISLPLFDFSHKSGVGLNISMSYAAGGIRTTETPSMLGLGWNLDVGGIITRTVRGMPDEYPVNGYLALGALPADVRPNSNKYYTDSLDAEQDIFQFSFNGRGGQFYIGKNKQIVAIPLSKMRIKYAKVGNDSLGMFTITNEGGVKYVFSTIEKASSNVIGNVFAFGYQNYSYPTAWHLTMIIAPFSTDTIQFNYTAKSYTNGMSYPKTMFVNLSGVPTDSSAGTGNRSVSNQRKVSSIYLPDKKTIQFIYSTILKYDEADYALDRITVSDSIFRYGYIFERKDVYIEDTLVMARGRQKVSPIDVRAFLSGVRYYTKTATMPGYSFAYNNLLFPKVATDTVGNKRDHWGFYKSSIRFDDKRTVPNIPGIYANGIDRSCGSIVDIQSSTLSSITLPTGGITEYQYENNTIYPYDISPQSISINGINSTQSTVSLNQVISNQFNFSIGFSSSVSRVGNPTFSGTANLTCSVTSLDGLTTYSTKIISLFQVFYVGGMSFSVSLPNGSYLFKTTISSGTTAPSGLPLVIKWDNETVVSGTEKKVGGIRVKYIRQRKENYGPYTSITQYKYETADGKSSGFLGSIPTYHYPVTNIQYTNFASPVTTNLYAICSEPISNVQFTQGNSVGYSRVIVIKSLDVNIAKNGKEVYEFTDLKYAQSSVVPIRFPFAPVGKRDWALGLLRRKLAYDSSGRLVASTTNTYSVTNTLFENSNFQSLKLGITTRNWNYNTSTFVLSPIGRYFTGQLFYPESGRADVVTSIDTLFNPDNSILVERKDIVYDTNFNVIKVIQPYSLQQGLSLEKRTYYAYNYSDVIGGIIKKLKDSSIFTPIASEEWITGDANPRILSGSVTEFQQLAKGYVVPLKAYSIVTNKPINQSTIGLFSPTTLIRNTTYFKPINEFSLYDSVANILELKTVKTGQTSSTIMGYSGQFNVAAVSNSKFSDAAYTSFESLGDGNWIVSSITRNTSTAITGKKSYSLSSGSITKSGLVGTTKYLVTYWTTGTSSATITGSSTPVLLTTQNGWRLYSHSITGVSSISISGTILIDELRIHPKDANMVTSTFEPMVGVTSSCDANNTITYTEYDALNRIVVTRDKDKNIIKKFEYSNTRSLLPTLQSTGRLVCSQPKDGNLYNENIDINPWSITYQDTILTFNSANCTTCAPPCPGNAFKLINCVCEEGCVEVLSTVYKQICNPTCQMMWESTYRYRWSDGTFGPNYVEAYFNPLQSTCPPAGPQ